MCLYMIHQIRWNIDRCIDSNIPILWLTHTDSGALGELRRFRKETFPTDTEIDAERNVEEISKCWFTFYMYVLYVWMNVCIYICMYKCVYIFNLPLCFLFRLEVYVLIFECMFACMCYPALGHTSQLLYYIEMYFSSYHNEMYYNKIGH